MGSSAAFHKIFSAEPGALDAGVPFARFMELAMYHPEAGYYTSDRRRVGKDKGADFFTATTFSPVFGELVVAAATGLLAPANPADFVFVEIGAEPGAGALRDVAHPFAAYKTISYGQPYELPPRCVVFSNELFDAQPFSTVVWRGGRWVELGVVLRGGELEYAELPALSPEVAAFVDRLPRTAPENYHIDLPLRTVPLLEKITSLPWSGLFLAFDYGKSWTELAESTPAGTGRTYSRQKMGTKLLEMPGEQDITCHICWDWLVDSLQRTGFGQALVESQEAFLAKRASARLAELVAAEAAGFSRRKQALMTLLHPGNMGQKFQALHALRS